LRKVWRSGQAVSAAAYFETIDAPAKRLIWFEHSAHNPPFAEPDAFVRAMVEDVLALVEADE
jgi:proline iminopeptidase